MGTWNDLTGKKLGVGSGNALPPLFSLTLICQGSPWAKCNWEPCNPAQRGALSCLPSKHSGINAQFSSGNCLPTLLPCNLNKSDGIAGLGGWERRGGRGSHTIRACPNAFQDSDYNHWFRDRYSTGGGGTRKLASPLKGGC